MMILRGGIGAGRPEPAIAGADVLIQLLVQHRAEEETRREQMRTTPRKEKHIRAMQAQMEFARRMQALRLT